jgi:hypothetical protein
VYRKILYHKILLIAIVEGKILRRVLFIFYDPGEGPGKGFHMEELVPGNLFYILVFKNL